MKWVYRFKWTVYVLAFLLTAVLQFTPRLLPSAGSAKPLLLIPAVVSVAMAEGELPGAVSGLLAGLLWDAQGVKVFGFDALVLLAAGMLAGLLVRYVFRNSVISALVFTLAACVGLELLSSFFFRFLFGDFHFLTQLWDTILPSSLYTLPFAVPYYYGARALSGWAARKAENV